MTPVRMTAGDRGTARARLQIAQRYLDLAEVAEGDQRAFSANASVGNCALAGIAAADVILILREGKYYSGTDHAEAAQVLRKMDPEAGRRLTRLVALKTKSHYGHTALSRGDVLSALRAARDLIARAKML